MSCRHKVWLLMGVETEVRTDSRVLEDTRMKNTHGHYASYFKSPNDDWS